MFISLTVEVFSRVYVYRIIMLSASLRKRVAIRVFQWGKQLKRFHRVYHLYSNVVINENGYQNRVDFETKIRELSLVVYATNRGNEH